MKRVLDGILQGMGFLVVVAVAFAIAYAGNVFTVDKDGTPRFAVSDAGKITVGATESYVNLVIQNDEVAAEADNKVDITADVLTVEGVRLENVNVSASIESSGAGGLDTGAEAANAWYYVWVITNNTGTSTNGLLSTSSTSPTMPSGFTKKRRVGAVRNNATNDFLQFTQESILCRYLDGRINHRIVNAGQDTSWTTISAAAYVPPTSMRAVATLGFSGYHNTANVWFILKTKRPSFGATQGEAFASSLTSAANVYFSSGGADQNVSLDAGQRIDYMINTVPSGGGGGTIDITGYYDRI